MQIGKTELGEVVRDRAANDTATDNDDVGAFWQLGHDSGSQALVSMTPGRVLQRACCQVRVSPVPMIHCKITVSRAHGLFLSDGSETMAAE